MPFSFSSLFAFAADRTVKFSSPVSPAGQGDRSQSPAGTGCPEACSLRDVPREGCAQASARPHIWFVPKDGKPIKAVAGFKAKEGENEIKLNDHLGVISFRGEGQPRGTLIVTPYDDEGPETKKHVVIQVAGDTKAEMAALPGDYAVWVVPESGARARRVVDKIRVQAGKTATAD